MNEKMETGEPEKIKKSKEKAPEKIFNDKKNQDVFEQLGATTIETVSSVYKNVKNGFIDRYRASNSNKLYNYHKERVGVLENDIIIKKRAIEQIEADIETHDIRIQKLSKQFGGLNEKVKEEISKEKKKLEKKLDSANYEETELIAKQVFNEKKLKKYEEKRNKIIEGIESFVSEKTEPYKENIDELKENTIKLDEDIEDFTSKRDVFEDQVNKLKEEFANLKNSKGGIYESESTVYLEKIKEVDAEYNRMDDIVKSVEKEKRGINRKIGKFETKISYWNRVTETAKSDNVHKQEEQYDPETAPTENTKEKLTENPEDNKDWYEAVMPSKKKINEYDKTKEWYEASGLSEENMENVANAEAKNPAVAEQKNEEVKSSESNIDKSEKENSEFDEGIKTMETQMSKYKEQWNKLFGKRLPLNDKNFSKRNVLTITALLRTNILGQRIELETLIENAVSRENDRLPISIRIEQKELVNMFDQMRKENDLFHKYTKEDADNK